MPMNRQKWEKELSRNGGDSRDVYVDISILILAACFQLFEIRPFEEMILKILLILKLARMDGELASCFPSVVQLFSYCKGRNYYTSGLLPLSPSNKRYYSIQRLSVSTCRKNSCYSKFFSGDSSSFLQASSLQHWFKNWQELRQHKLTASTFAGAVGFWPCRRARLWLEKIGAIEPFTGNLATCWNNIKEEEALEQYKLITGNTVLFPEFQVYGNANPDDNWLAASPDGVVDKLVYTLPSRGILEIKCPYFRGDMSNVTPYKRVPLYYIPQAQGLMEIMDKDWMDLYVWTLNGSSLFRIYRDVEYWNLLKIALADFWWKHVQPAREEGSRSMITDPFIQLKAFRPAPRHELYSSIACESKRIVDYSVLQRREIHDYHRVDGAKFYMGYQRKVELKSKSDFKDSVAYDLYLSPL